MCSQQGFNFPNLLEAQGLSKLVQMKGTFYPELVKVFYTCAHADMEGNLYSTINGVYIDLLYAKLSLRVIPEITDLTMIKRLKLFHLTHLKTNVLNM